MPKKPNDRKKILGVRMTARLRAEVKATAARQGLPVSDLFERMWKAYLGAEGKTHGVPDSK